VQALPNGKLLACFWDQGIYLDAVDRVGYATQMYPITDAGGHHFRSVWGFGVHPSNPSIIVHNRTDHRPPGFGTIGNIEAGYTENGGTTWQIFPSFPRGATTMFQYGFGSIACVPLSNGSWSAVWAGASSDPAARQPWVTLNKGVSWSPVNIPLTEWSGAGGFITAFDRHIVVADPVTVGRVYMHITPTSGQTSGLWRSDDGGFNQEVASFSGFNADLQAVPGRAGHLFFTAGGSSQAVPAGLFRRSTDAGVTWSTVPGLVEVWSFGFGEPTVPGGYPTVFAYGFDTPGLTWGLYKSVDNAATWTRLVTSVPESDFDWPTSVNGAWGAANIGKVWVGFRGSGLRRGVPA
jgi:hypothetical protein